MAAVCMAVLIGACTTGPQGPTSALDDDAITVASFNFDESVLLAELYAQAIEARGIRVVRQMRLGPRELVQPALRRGLVELAPEYAGSLLEFLSGRGSAAADLDTTLEDLRLALADRGLQALDPAPAQDRNVFVVTRSTADRLNLDLLSDLASTQGLVLGGPLECPDRPLCLPGLEGAYGIRFADFVPLDQAGPLTTDALRRGVVDVALLFSTSPQIVRYGFVVLEDDRHLQPAENVVPVVHGEAIARFGPELRAALDDVSAMLTTRELRILNGNIERGEEPAAVARAWLRERGLTSEPG